MKPARKLTEHDLNMRRKVRLDLFVCMLQHPNAQLAWDGICPASGTSNMLRGFHYDAEDDVIELEFD